MGVPDFLKFVARNAPGAFCQLPHNSSPTAAPTLVVDYVLVDATNVSQTVGYDALFRFLTQPAIRSRCAVILALDAQRNRSGTVRAQRVHNFTVDSEVELRQFGDRLAEFFESSSSATPAPKVLMSGRHVPGEADYKILHLHRTLVCAHAAANAPQPQFLFISEDSDLLCSALCGPAPQNVVIATKLHDATFDLCLLRLSAAVEYIGKCVDAFYNNDEVARPEANWGGHQRVEPHRVVAPAPLPPPEVQHKFIQPEVMASPPPPQMDDANVVRRKKQDGPLIAMGTRVVLADSSSDDDDEATGKPMASNPAPQVNTSVTSAAPHGSGPSLSAAVNPSQPGLVEETSNRLSKPSASDIAVANILTTSCIDMVLLHVIIMGNGASAPPIARGATKVDVVSCWSSYCNLKYAQANVTGSTSGEVLFTVSPAALKQFAFQNAHHADSVRVTLNSSFLLSILTSMRYADTQSRPPQEEEKKEAKIFLRRAMFTTLRYIVGCSVDCEAAFQYNKERGASASSQGQHQNLVDVSRMVSPYLDTRNEMDCGAPSIAALLSVLEADRQLTFTFSLLGGEEAGAAKRNKEASGTGAGSPLHTTAVAFMNPADSLTLLTPHADRTRTQQDDLRIPVPRGLARVTQTSTGVAGSMSLSDVFSSITGLAASKGMRNASRNVGVNKEMERNQKIANALMKSVAFNAGRVVDALHTSQANQTPAIISQLGDVWRATVGEGVLEVWRPQRVEQKQQLQLQQSSRRNATTAGSGAKSIEASAAKRPRQRVVETYNFELRRMAPMFHTENDSTNATTDAEEDGDRKTSKTHKNEEAALASPPSATSSGPTAVSSHKLALQQALGLSYSYTAAPSIPEGVVVSEEKPKKKPVKVQSKRPARSSNEGGGGGIKSNKSDGSADPATKAKKGSGRLGKKERAKLRAQYTQSGSTLKGQGQAEAPTVGKTTNPDV